MSWPTLPPFDSPPHSATGGQELGGENCHGQDAREAECTTSRRLRDSGQHPNLFG